MPGRRQLVNKLTENVSALDRRGREPMAVYRPFRTQRAFHDSKAKHRILRGGNRSGKSVSAALEFASFVTGVRLTGVDGKPLPWKFGSHMKNRIAWIIGLNQDHIGQTIHRLLFQEGLFRLIRDEHTRQWRIWNVNLEYDQAYSEQTVDSEPLITPMHIDTKVNSGGFAWDDRAKNVFESVTFANSTKLFAYPSTGMDKQGDPVDWCWIDENVEREETVEECRRRTIDRKGRFVWSAYPNMKNGALFAMSEIARKQLERKPADRNYTEFQLRASDNQFIDKMELAMVNEGSTEEEIRARDYGDWVFDAILMYDFIQSEHGIGSPSYI